MDNPSLAHLLGRAALLAVGLGGMVSAERPHATHARRERLSVGGVVAVDVADPPGAIEAGILRGTEVSERVSNNGMLNFHAAPGFVLCRTRGISPDHVRQLDKMLFGHLILSFFGLLWMVRL